MTLFEFTQYIFYIPYHTSFIEHTVTQYMKSGVAPDQAPGLTQAKLDLALLKYLDFHGFHSPVWKQEVGQLQAVTELYNKEVGWKREE